jgi:tRNA A37 threonylcarbamoyladenosine modification protein TsaB
MGRADFDPRKRLEEYHAALDRLDFDAIEAMFAPDAVYVSNGVGSFMGR